MRYWNGYRYVDTAGAEAVTSASVAPDFGSQPTVAVDHGANEHTAETLVEVNDGCIRIVETKATGPGARFDTTDIGGAREED